MQIALKIWKKAINKKEPGAIAQEGKSKIRITSLALAKKAYRARKRCHWVVSKKKLSEWYRWTDITCYENNEIFNFGDFNSRDLQELCK